MSSAPDDHDSSDAQELDAADHLKNGVELFKSGNACDAIAQFDVALKLEPNFVEAFIRRGIVFTMSGDHESALRDFMEAIRIEPTNDWAIRWRGSVFVKLNRFDEALADFDEGIRLKPADRNGYWNRANCYYRRQEFAEAIADCSKVIGFSEDSAVYSLRGAAYSWIEEYEAAISDYTSTLKFEPRAADIFECRGNAYFALREYETAVADLSTAINIDSNRASALRTRGRAWFELREFGSALNDLDKSIQLDPTDCDVFYYRGKLYQEVQKLDLATSDFTEAIRLNAGNRQAFRQRGKIFDQLGKFDQADSDFEMVHLLTTQENSSMLERKSQIFQLLSDLFSPSNLDELTLTERRFPVRVRADLQCAIEKLIEPMTVHHFSGVRKRHVHERLNLTALLVRDRDDPALVAPPEYEELDIGDERPLRCLKHGIWLVEENGNKFAIFLEPKSMYDHNPRMCYQIATVNNASGIQIAENFFKHLERGVQEARSYRGKILSLEESDRYSGKSNGIAVHRLHAVQRDDVILPRKTLELLERNVIKFVQRRSKLAQKGLSTKKGLLFYGPPGTGKTHTIHYLAGALEGMTTLLITAGQVGLLGEYMTLARLLQPSMVVIEDADLIARDRDSMDSPCEEALLNRLLNEMDGLTESADVLFILTTNRPETLEAALASRPGRIDQAIEFPFPDAEGREKLVKLYSRAQLLASEVIEATVKRTAGVSAAFIKELMRRATEFQLDRDDAIGMLVEDVSNALDEMLFKGGTLNRKLLGGGDATD